MSGTEQQRDAYDVSDREEPAREAQVCRHLDAALVSADADANHRDENSTCALHIHQPHILYSCGAGDLLAMEMKETTLMYEMPLSVRGIVSTKHMIAATAAQSTEHEAPAVTEE